nr:hypothetical protein [Tanacetum cinerariifolium]
MKRIIKELVKSQVKEQVSRILPRIEQSVKAHLEAKVLTRSSHLSRTSYAVAADLSEMELKKILIEKMECNKSIQCSNEQRNLYKALLDAYEADKTIPDSYGETVILKRRRKEPKSASDPLETATRSAGRVDTLTPELLAGPTYELMKGSCTSLIELEYHLEEVYKPTTDQLDWVNPEGQQYRHNLLQPLPLIPDNRDYQNIKWIEDLVPRTMWIQEPINYDKHALWGIIAITDLKIVEWHSYKHLDWITECRDDDKLYKFKEGDFKRLRLQNIEDMLLLLVQGNLSDLTIEERFAFNKRLNLTKPDMYRSDLKRREAYTAYSNTRGFIYQNKDKKNRLMQIDELYKFNDRTLNDVRNALDDRLKGIRMQYLPKTIWRKGDKDRAANILQAIDKMIKTKRIMRSLEKFVRGRLYEGDFRMLQRTI